MNVKTPLSRLRVDLKKTQAEMAKDLGLSQGHYSRIERIGESSPTRAAAIVALFPGRITELEVLYPARFALKGKPRRPPLRPDPAKRLRPLPTGADMSIAMARGSTSSPLGKLTFDVGHVRVDDETGAILTRQAHEAGYASLQEYVREILTVKAHGLDHVRRLYEQRLSRVAGNGKEKDGSR